MSAHTRFGCPSASSTSRMNAPFDIRNEKQLFIDDRFIASSHGVELRVNRPEGREIVLESETPWESYRVLVTSVVDTRDGLRMYYGALAYDEADRPYLNRCMAESEDGKSWTRPVLGLHEFAGNKENNIVAPCISGAPHYDPEAPLGEPWTMIGAVGGLAHPEGLKPPEQITIPMSEWRDPVFGLVPNMLALFTSRDGARWRIRAESLMPFAADCGTNQMFFDRHIGKFVAYLRGYPGRRTVHRYETDDPFRTPWAVLSPDAVKSGYGYAYLTNELPIVMDTDDQDHWQGDVQNPCVVQYPWAQDVYLAFPSLHRWYPGPAARGHDKGVSHRFRFFNDGMDEIHMYVSRDGIQWRRPAREAYVPLGVWRDWDGGSIFSGVSMVRRGVDLWQYFTALRVTHGGVVPTDRNVARVFRTVQRLDGFVSMDAGLELGEFATPLLVFEGNRLELNINCGALGEAWVEIQDEHGKPIFGFTLDDCDPIDRNMIAAPVTWRATPDVSGLRGRAVRLRFRMLLSKLYAFQFVND